MPKYILKWNEFDTYPEQPGVTINDTEDATSTLTLHGKETNITLCLENKTMKWLTSRLLEMAEDRLL